MSSTVRVISTLLLAILTMACSARQAPHKPTDLSASRNGKTPWQIGAKSVGPITPGQPIPQAAFQREGKDFDQLWTHQMAGLDEMSAMQRGLRDQDGFARVLFSKMDLSLQLRSDLTVRTIWVGPTVRSAAGTGKGSTLSEIAAAHGALTKSDVPPPNLCSVTTATLPWVVFSFRESCRILTQSSRVVRLFLMDPTADD